MEEADTSQSGKFPPTYGITSQKIFTTAANINQILQYQNAVTAFQTGKPIMILFFSVRN